MTKPHDPTLDHAILRGQLIALCGRWQQRAQEPVSRRGGYGAGRRDAYIMATENLQELLDNDDHTPDVRELIDVHDTEETQR